MVRLIASLPCLLLSALVACGGSSSPSGDDDPGPDARPSQLDPAACAPIAQNYVAAATACGTPLPSGAAGRLEGYCKKGVAAAALCGGDPARGLDCFETSDPDDFLCQAGETYFACNGDLAAALGMYCVIALGNPACASGIACQFDSDCSNGLGCNSATGQCFDKQAYCIGLPCRFNADCPSGQTCNGAEGACVGQ